MGCLEIIDYRANMKAVFSELGLKGVTRRGFQQRT
jgi:hypothetical protein